VAPGVATRGSHRSGRARISASGSSADRFAVQSGPPKLSGRVTWTWDRASMCSACFPRSVLPADASLPSTGSLRGEFPASSVLSKRYDFLLPVSPHFVSFAWRYLGLHSLFSLPDGRVHRQGLELVTRYLQPGFSRGEGRTSQVPGEPQNIRLPCSKPTPAGLLAPDHKVPQHGPWSSKGRGSHERSFDAQ
jgi:hypothetical protein